MSISKLASVSAPADSRRAAIALPVRRSAIRRGAAGLRWQTAVLGLLVVGSGLVLGWALVAQHRAFNSRAYDLGYFDQVIWNTAHGRWFETNFVEFNFLGEHFQPVLVLFAALYRVWPSVEAVLVIQSLAVAGAAVPLYLAAGRVLGSATAGLLVAAAYLLAPQVHWAALFDFHPELLGVATIFAAFALIAAGRPLGAVAVLSLLFVLKEDALLVGAGFAWLLWLGGHRRHAVLLLGLSALYGVLVLGLLMPALRGDSAGLLARYGYLGTGPLDMAATALRHPTLVLNQVTGEDQRRAVTSLLTSLAWLPLLSPALLVALPVLAVNLLSMHNAQHSLDLHYGVYPVALLLVAAVCGAASLARARRLDPLWRLLRVPPRRRTTVLAGLLLVMEAVAWATDSPLGGRFDPATYRRTEHAAAIERTLALIPPEAPLSAQSNLVPHLSQRRFIRDFPRIDHATHVVIDLKSWGIWQTTFEIYDRVLHELPSLGFCRVVEDDGVELYERRADCPADGPASTATGDAGMTRRTGTGSANAPPRWPDD